jgi:hypothetical protein
MPNRYSPVSSSNKWCLHNHGIMHRILTGIKKTDDEPTENSSRSCIPEQKSRNYD